MIKMKYQLVISLSVIFAYPLQAGNPERGGQAGATQLLINPYTRSAGWAGANQANTRGIEAQFWNVAGTVFTKKTELYFARTEWLVGSGTNINALGFTQKIGQVNALGIGIVNINGGNLIRTSEDQPEGGMGTFSPNFLNFSVSYARMFSDDIYGGVNVKIINERIPGVQATGIAIDGGIQYHTGKYKQIHFGVSIKNWGPKMQYRGELLTFQTLTQVPPEYQRTVQNRSSFFEMPLCENIGFSYDFNLTGDTIINGIREHRLSVAANCILNSFTYDNYLFGLEYAWKERVMLRAGFQAEKYIFDSTKRMTALTGPTAGLTIEWPINKEKNSTIGFDYSYRLSNPFGGVHSLGFRINL
ncbi:MAG: PorV/PorQ family protein [Bacteroidia bacterium]|nr:PorV/PorQ family protein [Bacteroidia bacterium]